MAKAEIVIPEMQNLVTGLDEGVQELQTAKSVLISYLMIYPVDHTLGAAVEQALAWGDELLPDVRRRLAMAQQLELEPNPNWPAGYVELADDTAISSVPPDEARQNGADAAQALKDGHGDLDPDVIAEVEANMNDPYFAAGFAENIDPDELAGILGTTDALITAGEVDVSLRNQGVTVIGTTLGTATRNTGSLALPSDYAGQWADAITEQAVMEGGDAPQGQAQYLGLLMQQGKFGTEFLTTVGEKIYDYERSKDGDLVWSPKSPMTSILDTDGNPVIDVMASYMHALGKNPDAAQDFFQGGDIITVEVNGQEMRVPERMQYLIQERTWAHGTDWTNGGYLGEALEAATTHYRNNEMSGAMSASIASRMFALIGDQTMSDEGWFMWKGMRENVANIMADYGPDLLRIGESGQPDDFGTSFRLMNEDNWGEDAPYGAVMDPVLIREILKTFGREDDDTTNLDIVLAGAMTASQWRQGVALHRALNDNTDPPAPIAMLEGTNIPGIYNANRESAAGLGWLVNAAYHGALDNKEEKDARNKLLADVLGAASGLPGVGPVGKWSKFAYDQIKTQLLNEIKKPSDNPGSAYGVLSREQKDQLRQNMLNQMLAQGYFDQEYVDEVNGPDGSRYQAPPEELIDRSTDPPTFHGPGHPAWEEWDFPINQFLDTSIYIPFNEGLNDGLSLAGR